MKKLILEYKDKIATYDFAIEMHGDEIRSIRKGVAISVVGIDEVRSEMKINEAKRQLLFQVVKDLEGLI